MRTYEVNISLTSDPNEDNLIILEALNAFKTIGILMKECIRNVNGK